MEVKGEFIPRWVKHKTKRKSLAAVYLGTMNVHVGLPPLTSFVL